jgi:rare lipoprotein A
VRVTNLSNRKSIIVRVNDRGPYHGDRVIDLSHKTADLLGFKGNGVARVRVDYVGRASLDGSDDRKLMATLRQGEPAPAPTVTRVASARPFVGGIASDSRANRGEVPVPAERPYTLGQDVSPALAARERLARRRQDVAGLRPVIERPAGPPLASAYAPVQQATPAAFVSGRGLY